MHVGAADDKWINLMHGLMKGHTATVPVQKRSLFNGSVIMHCFRPQVQGRPAMQHEARAPLRNDGLCDLAVSAVCNIGDGP